eukprot:jgi/Botrbrau1/13120/Bobra.0187s0077.1
MGKKTRAQEIDKGMTKENSLSCAAVTACLSSKRKVADPSFQQEGVSSKLHKGPKQTTGRIQSNVPPLLAEELVTAHRTPRKRKGARKEDLTAEPEAIAALLQMSMMRGQQGSQALAEDHNGPTVPISVSHATLASENSPDKEQLTEAGPSKEQGAQQEAERGAAKRRKRKTSRIHEMQVGLSEVSLRPANAEAAGQADTCHENLERPSCSTPVQPENLGMPEISWRATLGAVRKRRGRYSEAEETTIMNALKEYARCHNFSESDLSWAVKTQRSKAKGAWLEVARALPHRSARSIYGHGIRLIHEGNKLGKWTEEDTQRLVTLVAERGRRWAEIGAALGRMPELCRDRYRYIKLGNKRKTGKWSEEEERRLREIVNTHLNLVKTCQEAEGIRGPTWVQLDGIDWEFVADVMETRNEVQCRKKWYLQLSESMVERGLWGRGDDRRMLKALYESNALYDFEVDWANLVPGRGEMETRRRWTLMLKCVPKWQNMEFCDILDFLRALTTPKASEGVEPSSDNIGAEIENEAPSVA